MYDPRNEPHEFVADSREAAVAKAVQFFGLEPDALAVSDLTTGEVYGLGGRTAIVAVPRERKPAVREARGERRREREERPERGRRGDRGERRERGGRGDRGERRERGERAERREVEPAEPTEPSVGTPVGELTDAGHYLLGVLERMDLGPFELKEGEEGEVIVMEVRGPAARALAAGEARAVDALQLIVNQAALRRSEEPKRIVIDVEGNAESRDLYLSRLAERAVKRAVEGRRSIALDPMNGRDRRVIHLAVREHEGVVTMSIGEGRYRQVVVVPEGAPEYEEARRQCEAAEEQRLD